MRCLFLLILVPWATRSSRVKMSNVMASTNKYNQTHSIGSKDLETKNNRKSEDQDHATLPLESLAQMVRTGLHRLVGANESMNEIAPCENYYHVQFKLGDMHSYFEVPTCGARTSSIVRPGGLSGLDKCGKCNVRRFRGDIEIHWNIPHCTEKLCLWPEGSFGESKIIGPPDGIKMHPKCSWGIIRELMTVYESPWRAASLDGVMQALGKEGNKTWNWMKVLGAGLSGGMANLATAAAETVDWETRLNFDCSDARPREEILKKNPIKVDEKTGNKTVKPIGAVCWNNVIDFRDLWCYWQARIDVNDDVACDSAFSYGFREMPTRVLQGQKFVEAKALFTSGDLWKYQGRAFKCCTSSAGHATQLQDMNAQHLPAVRSFGDERGCGYMFGNTYHNGLRGYNGAEPSCPVSVELLKEITGAEYTSIQRYLEALG